MPRACAHVCLTPFSGGPRNFRWSSLTENLVKTSIGLILDSSQVRRNCLRSGPQKSPDSNKSSLLEFNFSHSSILLMTDFSVCEHHENCKSQKQENNHYIATFFTGPAICEMNPGGPGAQTYPISASGPPDHMYHYIRPDCASEPGPIFFPLHTFKGQKEALKRSDKTKFSFRFILNRWGNHHEAGCGGRSSVCTARR